MQLLSALHVSENRIAAGLHNVPEELDKKVAEFKLKSLGVKIETLTDEQKEYLASWRE